MEKITTRRREGVGVVVEKKKKVDELSSYTKHNKQFNKKTKLWIQNGRCLDDVTTAL